MATLSNGFSALPGGKVLLPIILGTGKVIYTKHKKDQKTRTPKGHVVIANELREKLLGLLD